MAGELKLRRGTTQQHEVFTGAQAEVTVDTDTNYLVVHDGVTPGGFRVPNVEGMLQELGNVYPLFPCDANLIQVVDDISTLRGITPNTNRNIRTKYHTSEGDGGGGDWYAVTGAAAGTYTDNNGTIIVPTGGDGGAAWLRVTQQRTIDPAWFGVAEGDDSSATKSANSTALKRAYALAGESLTHVEFGYGDYYFAAMDFDVSDYANASTATTAWSFADYLPGWIGQGANATRIHIDQHTSPIFHHDSAAGGASYAFARFEGITVFCGPDSSSKGRGFIDLPNNTRLTRCTFDDLQVVNARVGLRAHKWQCSVRGVNFDYCDYGWVWTEGTSCEVSQVFCRHTVRGYVFGATVDIDTDAVTSVNTNGIAYTHMESLACDTTSGFPYTFGVTRGVTINGIGAETIGGTHVFDFPLLSHSNQMETLNIEGLAAVAPISGTTFIGLARVECWPFAVQHTYPVSISGSIHSGITDYLVLDFDGGDHARQLFDISKLRANVAGTVGVTRGVSTTSKSPVRVSGGSIVGSNESAGYFRDGAAFTYDEAGTCQEFSVIIEIPSGDALYIPVTEVNEAPHLVVGRAELYPAHFTTVFSEAEAAALAQNVATVHFSAVGGNRLTVEEMFKSRVDSGGTDITCTLDTGADSNLSVKIASSASYGYVCKVQMIKSGRQSAWDSPAGWYVGAK